MIDRAKIKKKFRKHQNLIRLMRFTYVSITRPKALQRKVSFGSLNNDKVIYLIRPNSEDGIQGLMSLFIQTMRKIDFALSHGYIPFVDFKNYRTQYFNGKDNAWEFFFSQPSDLSIEEVYSSSHVILSGLSLNKNEDVSLYTDKIFKNNDICFKGNQVIVNNITYSSEVNELVRIQANKLNIESCIGIYVRGTDYTALKPSGEHIQPNIDNVIDKLHEFIYKYPKNKLFLVTEDNNYYKKLKSEFGDMLQIADFDTFVDNYSGNVFLSQSGLLSEDVRRRGIDYLVKIILLSKCKFLVSSITMGSIAAYTLNGNNFKDQYIFDLGLYD